jgi:hypothetical protein
VREWHTIAGGVWLDPKKHTEDECVAFVVYREMVSGDHRGIVERKKTAMAIRDAKTCGMEELVFWLAKRAHEGWLDYQTVTQRQWQRNTRRPSRARHHDSISIREKYVRCARS